MARKRKNREISSLLERLDLQLKSLEAEIAGLTLRQKVLKLVDLGEDFRDLGYNVVREAGIDSKSARDRIRAYLVAHAGISVDGAELAIVSGISEYPRRIRELRVEQGFHIASGATVDVESGIDLKPDTYLLVSAQPDADAARRWHIANRIRRSRSGSKAKILEFLQENVMRVVTTEELAYVANDAREFARRTRELRTEEGYAIATKFTGRPDLNMGEYVLENGERVAEPHDRKIPEEVQRQVYERDESTCRVCGWNRSRWTKSDPRILELHHLEHHAAGGKNSKKNLIVVCSKCHDEVHKGKHGSLIKKIEKSN